jgi:hypothetical protein
LTIQTNITLELFVQLLIIKNSIQIEFTLQHFVYK